MPLSSCGAGPAAYFSLLPGVCRQHRHHHHGQTSPNGRDLRHLADAFL